MIPLFKIRYKYLKRHPCSLVLGYLFIPVILTLVFFFASIIKAIIVRGERGHSHYDDDYYSSSSIKHNNQYENNSNNSVIVKDIKKGLSQFIKKSTNIQLDYFHENQKNHILKKYKNVIIYKEEKVLNNFDIKIKHKLFNFNISNIFNNFKLSNLKKKFLDFIHTNRTTKIKTNKISNLKSLISKHIENDKNIKNFSNITINSEVKNFNSLGIKNNDDDLTDLIIGIVISFEMTLFSYYLTGRMIDEKEHKLNDFLERQGISKKRYALSWLVTYSILAFLPFVGFMCFGGFFFIFNYEFFLICLVLYYFSIYSFIYFFYTIIDTLKKGSIVIKIFNFAGTIIGAVLTIPHIGRYFKLIFILIPHVNIYYTVSIMYYIGDKDKFDWSILHEKVREIRYWENIIFYVVEIIFYNVITCFVQSYKSSGLSFCLYLKSFCCHVSRNANNEINQPLIINDEQVNLEIHHQDLTIIQKQKKRENKMLKISGVTKKFGHLKAVNNFNVELFYNEIFCLLGHNGAGKTTLVNVISGLMEPENGDVFLNGVSIITNQDLIYKNIGLCQQQNILFEFLTVSEHLQFIYDIKGIARDFKEIQELILKLDLSDVQFRICKDLSGGQKRKLCIALALLSGGKIIILDEPTSGMDIIAKKKLWDFLKNYQKDKIILITTHSLEEAEYLGTRIGIMSDGHFICSGTSTYLKSMYPCGININLVINSRTFSEDSKRIIFEKIREYEPLA